LAFATAWVFTLALPGLLFVLDARGNAGSTLNSVQAEAPETMVHTVAAPAGDGAGHANGAKRASGIGTAQAASPEPTQIKVSDTDRRAPPVLQQPPDNEPASAPRVSGREDVPRPREAEVDAAASVASLVAAPTAIPPVWQQNAALAPSTDERPVIAIVLDDLGLNRPGTQAAIELEAPLTLAFMSYAERLSPMLDQARRRGHELMLHFPMEPLGDGDDPGPKALMTWHAPWEIRLYLEWGLARVPGIVGVNNHMGSRFTAEPEAMASVMEVLQERGLFYLDSRTTASDVGSQSAAEAGVPFLSRDVFIDHGTSDREAVLEQLTRLERIARTQGHAIGIGHPHQATLAAIAAWRQGLAERGLVLVPVTEILRRRLDRKSAEALPDQG
jgi:polysaccharide deacetylase 2 family uncharacterized protein YibQ